TWRQVAGAACLAGIGFTVSLFIGELAFVGPALAQAKLAVLIASAAAAVLGTLILLGGPGRGKPAAEPAACM
ncbi:MAG: Na+/H+ antiporter NhaA, partial [Armatimonadetes bacterium]|nr:Na+/H+ antiporter NhaA [Armatimonadota bacterium]